MCERKKSSEQCRAVASGEMLTGPLRDTNAMKLTKSDLKTARTCATKLYHKKLKALRALLDTNISPGWRIA